MATATHALTPFEPDYAVAPGELLAEVLDDAHMTQTELARRLGVTLKHVNKLVAGDATLSKELAIRLERVTGVSAGLWNGMEANYRDHLARKAEDAELTDQVDWLSELPLRAMIRCGYVADQGRDKVAQVRAVLEFLGVASRDSFTQVCSESSYRKAKAFVANPADVAVWLRAGELAAASIDTEPYDQDLFRNELEAFRAMTVSRSPDQFFDELVDRCAACGVAVVVIPEIGKTRASGASRWMSPHRALVQLSNRGKWAEAFWFTFFHEAAHILLHPKKIAFIDNGSPDESGGRADGRDDRYEAEADRFAHDLLIPREHLRRLAKLRSVSDVQLFAAEIGVGSAIVAGRLHKEGLIPPNWFQKPDIHPRYSFDESTTSSTGGNPSEGVT